MHDKTPAAQHPRTRQNINKTKLIGNQSKTVRPSSRGNQNFEAARCYKSRKNAVRPSSRSNQNFEAARCHKTRKDGPVKVPTPVKILIANKANLTRTPTKYKFHKVRIPSKYEGHKVRIPTKYKGHKVRMPTKYKGHKVQIPAKYKGHKVRMPTKYKLHKIQIPCPRHVNIVESSAHIPTRYRDIRKDRLPHRNKLTPYGPYNIPHMVLCTKQGPDNA